MTSRPLEADWSDKLFLNKKPLASLSENLKNKIWAPVNKVQKSSVPHSGIPIKGNIGQSSPTEFARLHY